MDAKVPVGIVDSSYNQVEGPKRLAFSVEPLKDSRDGAFLEISSN